MKSFCRFCLIMLWGIILIGLGHQLVFHNLGCLVTGQEATVDIKISPSEMAVQTGPWVEKLTWPRLPEKAEWIIPCGHGQLAVTVSPHFTIKWQNPNSGRKSIPDGE